MLTYKPFDFQSIAAALLGAKDKPLNYGYPHEDGLHEAYFIGEHTAFEVISPAFVGVDCPDELADIYVYDGASFEDIMKLKSAIESWKETGYCYFGDDSDDSEEFLEEFPCYLGDEDEEEDDPSYYWRAGDPKWEAPGMRVSDFI